LEFWITPFDYAGCEGRSGRRERPDGKQTDWTILAVIDYDDVNSNKRSFWNLSHKQTMYGNASDLVDFA